LNEPSDAALILEFDLLVASLTVGDETHVDEGFKLDVCSGLERMQMQLEGLGISFTADFNHIVEVALAFALELDVELDGEAGGDIADVFVVAAEVRSLGL